MAKVFVSSRLRELHAERKIVVEILHLCGHTPLFFERHPSRHNPTKVKKIMDTMIQNSDALIQIQYLTCGEPMPVLSNLTPIHYEFKAFCERGARPCILLRKEPDPCAHVSKQLQLLEKELREGATSVIQFKEAEELVEILPTALDGLGLRKDHTQEAQGLVISYSGRDFVGLLEAITGTLFQRFRLNVNYMSYAAVGGSGTMLLTCTPREAVTEPLGDYALSVLQTLRGEVAGVQHARLKGEEFSVDPLQAGGGGPISVALQAETPVTAHCYLEVRHADLPGQIAAVCRVIRSLEVNIDELQLHPTEFGLSKQKVLRLWVSHSPGSPGDRVDSWRRYKWMLRLEAELSNLIGVRSVEMRRLTRGV